MARQGKVRPNQAQASIDSISSFWIYFPKYPMQDSIIAEKSRALMESGSVEAVDTSTCFCIFRTRFCVFVLPSSKLLISTYERWRSYEHAAIRLHYMSTMNSPLEVNAPAIAKAVARQEAAKAYLRREKDAMTDLLCATRILQLDGTKSWGPGRLFYPRCPRHCDVMPCHVASSFLRGYYSC